jgi:hypothetical protein
MAGIRGRDGMSGDGGGGEPVAPGAPVLVLGPMLRYVDETAATIWVETDRPCQVEILGRQARTFEVAGHHYGLVVADGLQPGSEQEYQVALDGALRWPEPGSEFGPSVLRTLRPGRPLRLVFGSCRVAELPAPPRRRSRGTSLASWRATDALAACAHGLRQAPRERWPDVLLLIGDQVYADNPGPATRRFIERRRDPTVPPGYEVADFDEYCFLYREAWREPAVRWLLSVVPTAMIFDDHDVHDDWNTSAAWRREYAAKPWWRSRITGAYMSYWLYQHLGNLSPDELGKDELWRQVRESPDASALLAGYADRADQRAAGIRWSFRRDYGGVRVVVIDSRSRRVLKPGRRRMTDEAEWRWVTESVSGDADHLVLASSLPLLLPRGVQTLEAWSEAVCDGVWGKRFSRAAERLRRAVDLEHWAAFGASFADFERLLTGLTTGAHGKPPASITILGGDIHHSYLAPVDLRAGTSARSAVHEAVCSPIHNVLPESFRVMQRLATSRAGELCAAALAWLAGVRGTRIRWRITHGPWFENMLCTLEFDRRAARIRFDRAICDEDGTPALRPACETRLS